MGGAILDFVLLDFSSVVIIGIDYYFVGFVVGLVQYFFARQIQGHLNVKFII